MYFLTQIKVQKDYIKLSNAVKTIKALHIVFLDSDCQFNVFSLIRTLLCVTPKTKHSVHVSGRLSCLLRWDVTPTAFTSSWRKKQMWMLQINKVLLPCTEL